MAEHVYKCTCTRFPFPIYFAVVTWKVWSTYVLTCSDRKFRTWQTLYLFIPLYRIGNHVYLLWWR